MPKGILGIAAIHITVFSFIRTLTPITFCFQSIQTYKLTTERTLILYAFKCTSPKTHRSAWFEYLLSHSHQFSMQRCQRGIVRFSPHSNYILNQKDFFLMFHSFWKWIYFRKTQAVWQRTRFTLKFKNRLHRIMRRVSMTYVKMK